MEPPATGCVYCIVNVQRPELYYVGSTRRPLWVRMLNHWESSLNGLTAPLYCAMRSDPDPLHWHIFPIQEGVPEAELEHVELCWCLEKAVPEQYDGYRRHLPPLNGKCPVVPRSRCVRTRTGRVCVFRMEPACPSPWSSYYRWKKAWETLGADDILEQLAPVGSS